MACEICGRGACMKSFHSLEAQAAFDSVDGMSERQLKQEVLALRSELEETKQQLEELLRRC